MMGKCEACEVCETSETRKAAEPEAFSMIDKDELIKRESEAIIQTYTRQDVVLVRGSGVKVWDSNGKEYLDFVAGIAVNNVGHCHPRVVEAICQQAARLIHTSNLYYTEKQVQLAEELKGLTGMKRAYFCNSGAESVEAALKLRPGMTIAIEPMVNAGLPGVKILNDGWTVVTQDGSLSAHFEHTVLITEAEPEILTCPETMPSKLKV